MAGGASGEEIWKPTDDLRTDGAEGWSTCREPYRWRPRRTFRGEARRAAGWRGGVTQGTRVSTYASPGMTKTGPQQVARGILEWWEEGVAGEEEEEEQGGTEGVEAARINEVGDVWSELLEMRAPVGLVGNLDQTKGHNRALLRLNDWLWKVWNMRVTLTISGEVNVLLKQPAVGPWDALQAEVGRAGGQADIKLVLDAVKATRCFADTLEVEALAQVQIQELGEPG